MKCQPITMIGAKRKSQAILSKIVNRQVDNKVVLQPSVKFLMKSRGMTQEAATKLFGTGP